LKKPKSINFCDVVDSIQAYFCDYMIKSGLKTAVLGVSGGLDSAVIAALVSPICKANKWNLIGVMLPSITNKKDENDRAEAVCKAFCTEIHYHPVEYISSTFNHELGINLRKSEALRRGNIKARLRMIALYDYASSEHGLVLGTDNYTEYMLGFWTLHGDVGDLSLIQNLWKTEVYEVAKTIVAHFSMLYGEDKDLAKTALESCIYAIPTDGLGITGSDLEAFGATSYNQVDDVLKRYLRGDKSEYILKNSIVQKHKATEFKRYNPLNMPRPAVMGGFLDA